MAITGKKINEGFRHCLENTYMSWVLSKEIQLPECLEDSHSLLKQRQEQKMTLHFHDDLVRRLS